MDAPQWYNTRLWNTSKQSIDGKPIRPSLRPQSANITINRPGFNIQPMTSNWPKFMRSQNMFLSNREQGYALRSAYPYLRSKSPVARLSDSFTSKYYSALSPNLYFPVKNNDRVNSALNNKPKPVNPVSETSANQSEYTSTSVYNPAKMILKPNLYEYESRLITLPPKEKVVHGNINVESKSTENDGEENVHEENDSETDLSHSFSENVMLSPTISVPQNTPRQFDLSSQTRQPTKSILKKPLVDISQPNIPTFTIYSNFYPSRVRTISASSKTLISSQGNNFSNLRKSLQSAPGSKREVRFDTTKNVIEYSPND